MLDGEHCVIPLVLVIFSITEPVVPEDAAPIMASTFSVINRSTVALAISASVPESPGLKVTGAPLTPPAALISAIAMLTPSSIGADKNASGPVSGSNVPMFKPSAEELSLLDELAEDSPLLEVLSSSSPQAAATSVKANNMARSLNRRLFRIYFPS